MLQRLIVLVSVLIGFSLSGFAQTYRVTLNFSALDSLQNGFHYEGWAIVNDQPFSTGKFNVNSNGELVDMDGNVIPNGEFMVEKDLSDASAIVLTIEPEGDPNAAPASTHYLAGDVFSMSADLSVGHPAALGDDYSASAGDYILATPTNGADTNENSGIWFLELSTTVNLDFSGLDSLKSGFHYEGWAIVNDHPVSTGKFNVNSSGELIDMDGNVIENGEFTIGQDLSAASAIVLTIEPDDDPSPMPASTHYLAGDISDMSASLTVDHPAALGDDFTGSTGNYILATPTNGDDSNENSGIWFLDLSEGSPAQGLFLPTLPDGWEYEGWTVINGMPVTTGKFLKTDSADFAAPYSGEMSGPPFPGEDFLMNAPDGLTFPTDIAGGNAVISIEPSPDDAGSPFTLKPLAGMIPGDATDHTTYAMNNNAGSFPTGNASLTVHSPMAGLDLPTLPYGWNYEGWVVVDGTPVTSGKFLKVDSADYSAPYSGEMSGPPFPGEDFLMNAPEGLSFPTDIAGGNAVISIEPSPDDAAGPFTLKPLAGMIPSNAADHVTYAMNNNAGSFPTGTAELEDVTAIDDAATTDIPDTFHLFGNFPNPFNPSTNIRFNIAEASQVELTVYNAMGQKVATVVNEFMAAGKYKVTFDAQNLSSGIYVYQLEAQGFSDIQKMILLK
ncbi:MAG: T9SS type A sorting domain-containing protein [Caldithrix sp.]|nr:T9SS type A sorting domain-containing protein [Caldithrix sp.]